MKIGIDFHGVIEDYPEIFKSFLEVLVKREGEVHILTGPDLLHAYQEVTEAGYLEGVHYTKLHSVVDHLKGREVESWLDEKGRFWASDEDWWSSKALMCEELGLDLMIDDSKEYEPYFEDLGTDFVLVGRKG